MKISRIVPLAALFASLIWGSACLALTKKQKKELISKGQISVYDDHGNKKGHFETNFMSGVNDVTADAAKAWEEAVEDIMGDYIEKEKFWSNKVGRSFFDGTDYVKKSVVDFGVNGVKNDFEKAKNENKEVSGFGSLGRKTFNWLKFGGKAVGRTVGASAGTVVGSAYAVLAPTAYIVSRPFYAAGVAATGGVIFPVARYAWNGIAFVLVQHNDEPQKGDITVTYVANPDYVAPEVDEGSDVEDMEDVDSDAETVVTTSES